MSQNFLILPHFFYHLNQNIILPAMSKTAAIFILHIIGCIVFLALPIFLAPDFPSSLNIFSNTPTQRDLIAYVLMTCFFYLNFFILIPKFYFTKRYFAFFSIIFLCFIVVSVPSTILLPQSIGPAPATHSPNMQLPPPGLHNPPPEQFNNYLFPALHYLFIFLALVFFSLILRINNRLRQSEQEKLHAELMYLKAQINPHFLFNTLNNIYSLAVERSDKTPNAVLRLSDMMRYVISDAGKNFVPLQQELDYVRNYIELQLIRFGDAVDLNFKINGTAGNNKIAPLILIPFIENAFKYGVNAEVVSLINIRINILSNNLQMMVENSKVKFTAALVERSGLGIANTKNRLQYLYAGKHELIIKDNDKFFVSLFLNMK